MKVRNGKLQTVDGTVPVEGKLKLCCVWICKLLVDWAASGTSEGKGDLDFILSQGQGVELANATADCICIFVFVYLYLYIWIKSTQSFKIGALDKVGCYQPFCIFVK